MSHISGPPENQFLLDVRQERVKLSQLARELSNDKELQQASLQVIHQIDFLCDNPGHKHVP